MTVTVSPVDAAGDAPLIHRWATGPRAGFWGMSGLGEAEVAEIYQYIHDQPHLAAYLVIVGDLPLGVIQTYDPAVDEIGDWYDRAPGDLGVHYLLADDPRRAGHTSTMMAAVLTFVTGLPGCRRLVFEPDARNAASIALLDRLGAERGPLVEMRTSITEKPAQFFFLGRDRALELARELAGD